MPIEKLKSLTNFRPFKLKNSLSIRLFSYVFICSTALVIIITLVQLLFDYKHDTSKIQATIDQVESSFLQPLAVSLWSLDREQVEIQTKSVVNLPYMQYVKVHEVVGNTEVILTHQGTIKESFDISKKFELVHQGQIVGTLFIAASLDQVYDNLIEKSLFILIAQTIKTMVIAFCILFIIHYLVICHIN